MQLVRRNMLYGLFAWQAWAGISSPLLTLMLQGGKSPLRLLHLPPIQRIIEFLASSVRERCDQFLYTSDIFPPGPKSVVMPTEALQLTAGLQRGDVFSRFRS